ncbi:MAG: hypothetical protein IJ811_04060 [Clostridia bacterium]|nr:hypothetical protein [Clostridia bacterium]
MKTNCFLKAIISVALCLTISFAFASCSDDGAPGAQTFVGSIDGVRILEAEDGDYTGVFAKVPESRASNAHAMQAQTSEHGSIVFGYSSDRAVNVKVSAKISYVGAEVNMDKVFSLTINGKAVDLTKSPVYKTSSSYRTFYEFPLTETQLVNGDNRFVLENQGGGFSIDYLALHSYHDFDGSDTVFEGETGMTVGIAMPTADKAASEGASMMIKNGDREIIEFDSDDYYICPAQVMVGHSYFSDIEKLNDAVKITVNGEDIYLKAALKGQSGKAFEYYEYLLPNLFIRKGRNVVVIKSNYSDIYVDYLVVERAIVSGVTADLTVNAYGCSATDGGRQTTQSGMPLVEYNDAGAKIYTVINSDGDQLVDLYLSVAYWGSKTVLADIMLVSVNGYLFDLSTISAVKSAKSESQAYFDYSTYSLGRVTLSSGANVIKIFSVSGDYNFNAITIKK